MKPGYVYAVVNEHAGAVKIGSATVGGLRRRYWEAGNWNVQPLIVHSESYHADAFRAEHNAHKRLGHARLPGWGKRYEWFSLADADVRRWLAERVYIGVSLIGRIDALAREISAATREP
jgi:T5orf172 domain